MDEHYLLPSEVVIIVAFMFAPPSVLFLTGQAWFLLRRGVRGPSVLLSSLATLVLSLMIITALNGLGIVPNALRMCDVWLFDKALPVSPIAYLVNGFVASVVSILILRRCNSAKKAA